MCHPHFQKVDTVQLEGFFQFPTHPSGADLFAPYNPTQTLPVIL